MSQAPPSLGIDLTSDLFEIRSSSPLILFHNIVGSNASTSNLVNILIPQSSTTLRVRGDKRSKRIEVAKEKQSKPSEEERVFESFKQTATTGDMLVQHQLGCMAKESTGARKQMIKRLLSG